MLKYQDHNFTRAYGGISNCGCGTSSTAKQISVSHYLVWLTACQQDDRAAVGILCTNFSDEVGQCSHLGVLDLALTNDLREIVDGIKGIFIEFCILDADAKGRFYE